MTFKELKDICNKVSGRLYVKDSRYTDEVFFYYCRLPDEDNEKQEVWLNIDSYDEKTIIHETAKEIVMNLSDKHNDVSCAKDDDIVQVLYTDTLVDIIRYEIKDDNIYLYTE